MSDMTTKCGRVNDTPPPNPPADSAASAVSQRIAPGSLLICVGNTAVASVAHLDGQPIGQLIDDGQLSQDDIIVFDQLRRQITGSYGSRTADHNVVRFAHDLIEARLRNGLTTVIIDGNTVADHRRTWINLARNNHADPIIVQLDTTPQATEQANQLRTDHLPVISVADKVTAKENSRLKGCNSHTFRNEGAKTTLDSTDLATIQLMPSRWDGRHIQQPVATIGDIHGCWNTLEDLLAKLGFRDQIDIDLVHPDGMLAALAGDFINKGTPQGSTKLLRWAHQMHQRGRLLVVPGNHEMLFADVLRAARKEDLELPEVIRQLRERNTEATCGIADIVEQLHAYDKSGRTAHQLGRWIENLPVHIAVHNGNTVIAHAGIHPDDIGREDRQLRYQALYDKTQTWAETVDDTHSTTVVHGHITVDNVNLNGNVISVDTGAVDGNLLSALVLPERTVHQVPTCDDDLPHPADTDATQAA